MANRLYVIGNGFDLAHGISCRYQDFKRYCQEYNEEMYRHIDLFYTDTDKLWSDFEAEMPNIDENRLFSWATALNPEWNQDWNGYHQFVDTIKEEVDYLHYLPYSFRDLVKGWRKDTNRIIRQNVRFFDSLHDVTEIFVLGHSMASVDMLYFQEIKSNVQPDAVWTLSVYSQADKQRKNKAIQELQLRDENVYFIELDDLSTQGRLNFEN